MWRKGSKKESIKVVYLQRKNIHKLHICESSHPKFGRTEFKSKIKQKIERKIQQIIKLIIKNETKMDVIPIQKEQWKCCKHQE